MYLLLAERACEFTFLCLSPSPRLAGMETSGSGTFENCTMDLRNSEKLRLSNARTHTRLSSRIPHEKSLLREERSKTGTPGFIERGSSGRNVRVIPDHFEQNSHYDPILIVTCRRIVSRGGQCGLRRDYRPPRASLFRNKVYVTLTLLRHCDNKSSLELNTRRISTFAGKSTL